jgi:hypothetical protein
MGLIIESEHFFKKNDTYVGFYELFILWYMTSFLDYVKKQTISDHKHNDYPGKALGILIP